VLSETCVYRVKPVQAKRGSNGKRGVSRRSALAVAQIALLLVLLPCGRSFVRRCTVPGPPMQDLQPEGSVVLPIDSEVLDTS